jgi:hypothetical protein
MDDVKKLSGQVDFGSGKYTSPSMPPLAKVPTAAQGLVVSTSAIDPGVNRALESYDPAIRRGVRDVANRK